MKLQNLLFYKLNILFLMLYRYLIYFKYIIIITNKLLTLYIRYFSGTQIITLASLIYFIIILNLLL